MSTTPAFSPIPTSSASDSRRLLAELPQVHLAGLVGAVLAPHDRVHREFGAGRAAAEDLPDAVVLVGLQAEFAEGLRVVRRLSCMLDRIHGAESNGVRHGRFRPAGAFVHEIAQHGDPDSSGSRGCGRRPLGAVARPGIRRVLRGCGVRGASVARLSVLGQPATAQHSLRVTSDRATVERGSVGTKGCDARGRPDSPPKPETPATHQRVPATSSQKGANAMGQTAMLSSSEVNNPRPSVPGPVRGSMACSGCGISPTTLPAAFVIPAMSRREPLGLPPT